MRLWAVILMLTTTLNMLAGEKVLEIDLDSALSMALDESLDIRNGQFEVYSSQIQHKLSITALLPSVSVDVTDYNSVLYDAADSENSTIKFSVSQPVFRGGRIINARNRQKIKIASGRESLIGKTAQLRQACYSTYFTYLIEERKIDLQKNVLSLAREQLAIAKTEMELGRIREIDFLSTQIEVQSMEQRLEDQLLNYAELTYKLKRLLGLPLEQDFKVVEVIPDNYTGFELELPVQKVVQMALESNSELRMGLLELENKKLEYRQARNGWLPNISLEGSLSLTGTSLPLQKANYDIGVSVELPLPWIPLSGSFSLRSSPSSSYGNSGQIKANGPNKTAYQISKKKARLALENARINYDNKIKDLIFQVHIALTRYNGMRKSLALSISQVALMERQLNILTIQTDLGQATRLELVSGQNKYVEKRLALLEGILNLLISERALEQFIGIPFNTIGNFGAAS